MGAKKLHPWIEIVRIEERLIDRLRSGFLVRWFGKDFPMDGLAMRVGIVNLDALRDRYQEVIVQTYARREGVNLTEPFAGLAGTLVGLVLSPGGLAAIGAIAVRAIWRNGGILALALGAIVGIVGGHITLFVMGVVGGVRSLFGPSRGGDSNFNLATLRAIHDVLGAVAGLLISVRTFIEQLLGPRSGVRNPLMRAVLTIFERLSPLVAHLSVFFAIAIARVLPLVRPWVEQGRTLHALAHAVFGILSYLFEDLVDRLRVFNDPRRTPLRGFFALGQLASRIQKPIHRGALSLFEKLRGWLTTRVGMVSDAFSLWWKTAKPIIESQTTEHPSVQTVIGLKAQIDFLRNLLSSATASSPPAPPNASASSSSSMFTPPALPDVGAIQRQVGGPGVVRNAAIGIALVQMRNFLRAADPSLPVDPFARPRALQEALDRARRPPSFFAQERLRLRDAEGRSTTEQLSIERGRQAATRALMMEVIQRILPQAAREYVPQLEEAFDTVDSHVFRNVPIKKLPETDRLDLLIGELCVQADGRTESDLNTFSSALRAAIEGQAYQTGEAA